MLLASLLALTANVHRDSDSRALTALDFLPWMQDEDEDDDGRSPEDMIRMIEALNAAFGGQDLRPSTNADAHEYTNTGEAEADA